MCVVEGGFALSVLAEGAVALSARVFALRAFAEGVVDSRVLAEDVAALSASVFALSGGLI